MIGCMTEMRLPYDKCELDVLLQVFPVVQSFAIALAWGPAVA